MAREVTSLARLAGCSGAVTGQDPDADQPPDESGKRPRVRQQRRLDSRLSRHSVTQPARENARHDVWTCGQWFPARGSPTADTSPAPGAGPVGETTGGDRRPLPRRRPARAALHRKQLAQRQDARARWAKQRIAKSQSSRLRGRGSITASGDGCRHQAVERLPSRRRSATSSWPAPASFAARRLSAGSQQSQSGFETGDRVGAIRQHAAAHPDQSARSRNRRQPIPRAPTDAFRFVTAHVRPAVTVNQGREQDLRRRASSGAESMASHLAGVGAATNTTASAPAPAARSSAWPKPRDRRGSCAISCGNAELATRITPRLR